jgi:hypothetical protein
MFNPNQAFVIMLNFMALYGPQGWKMDTIEFGRPICDPWV